MLSAEITKVVSETITAKTAHSPHVATLEEYKKLHASSIDDPESFFRRGYLNASVNCVDRWALKHPEQESDEPGQHVHISYGDMLKQVCMLANVLKSFGVKKGDIVAIYLPMVPEAVYAMLACARIGAIHSFVFAGFSAEALRDRISDANCALVITADQGCRGGKRTPLKKITDKAVAECPSVKNVLVLHRPYCPPEIMYAEDPLFILYMSGSTGKPKGVLHTTAGHLLGAALTADVGWITGHSYTVWGPLVIGSTTLVFESILTYPNPGRYWQMVETHKLTQFYTAPTAIRALRRPGDKHITSHDLNSLRVLGSVGEPINPEAWHWYNDVIGNGKCPIVDTYWQTEAGSIMISPLPGAVLTKPGSATVPFFGFEPKLLDPTTDKELEAKKGESIEGVLYMKTPWPSMARTIYGDHKRYLETYMALYPGYYITGDGAEKDSDDYIWIKGRVDDVINVSGHRLSTAEIESALIAHPRVAESTVIGMSDDVTGQAIFAYVVLKDDSAHAPVAYIHQDDASHADLVKKLSHDLVIQVRSHIGPFASPKRVVFVPYLPKTRSGKIMRRILRKIANGEVGASSDEEIGKLGDLSTLADPSIVATLIRKVHNL
ncbi:acetate--CoA ligase [Gonapodya prolifera JEL478]|uniref:acetate--CoA ligase n=1 Tax=Gonapodya prolifera (strain JEL478) TaxID=1344416 RepID=A0A139AJF4_GONPJ|nr:acetate--CoA ligase [Gonapodya prolifera JEL478]|eukprot:KXS16936.1 acetate--CoA ligase [Gonapodya prolifera JEL478]